LASYIAASARDSSSFDALTPTLDEGDADRSAYAYVPAVDDERRLQVLGGADGDEQQSHRPGEEALARRREECFGEARSLHVGNEHLVEQRESQTEAQEA
jgi:hypothetical protein